MARTMTPREIAETLYILQMARDPDAKKALAALGEKPGPQSQVGVERLGIYVVDDPSHDMWHLKPCGFLVCPETDL